MKVSILIPVYGVEKYIERCARSVFEQTYEDLEIIFVDDCSPDNSIAILKQVMEDYPNRRDQIKIIQHKKNKGLAAARNTGVENAIGDFVMFVDSDDWTSKDAVSLLLKEQEKSDADMVIGGVLLHEINGEKLIYPLHSNSKSELIHASASPHSIECSIWRRLIRKSLFVDNKIRCIEGINMGEDIQVTLRLCYYAKRISWIDDVVYHYNLMNSNSYVHSGTNPCKLEENYFESMRSWNVNRKFFKNKGDELLFIQLEKNVCFYAFNGMILSAQNGHKERFDKFKKCFKSINESNWNFNGSNNKWIVRLKENYSFARFLYSHICLYPLLSIC
jgi:glycosyltransferase involved in cell wall biosynthesis